MVVRSTPLSESDTLTAEQAEQLTGIGKLTVSRWRKKLKDIPKYRASLMATTQYVVSFRIFTCTSGLRCVYCPPAKIKSPLEFKFYQTNTEYLLSKISA